MNEGATFVDFTERDVLGDGVTESRTPFGSEQGGSEEVCELHIMAELKGRNRACRGVVRCCSPAMPPG